VTGDGAVWVSDASNGKIYVIDADGTVTPRQVTKQTPARFDLVATPGEVIATDVNTGLVYMVDASGRWGCFAGCSPEPHSDVAADNNETWILDGEAGTVAPLDQAMGSSMTRAEPKHTISGYEGSSSADFALGFERFWVTDGNGHLWVTDPETGKWSSHDIGFDIGDMTVGDDAIWIAASDNDSTDGALLRVDPTTGEVAESLPLSGNPVDVAVDGGSVWVVRQSADSVARVER
jgi:outer membrane protein assembly factor BamB